MENIKDTEVTQTKFYEDIEMYLGPSEGNSFESFIKYANIFRRTLISNIPIFTIDQFSVFDNSSCISNSHLAMILGELPLIQNDDLDEETPYIIDWQADDKRKQFTSKDIPELEFTAVTPIITLNPGEKIKGRIFLSKGIGAVHPKWKCVSHITWQPNYEEETLYMKIRSLKMLDAETLIESAFMNMKSTINDIPPTSFYYILETD